MSKSRTVLFSSLSPASRSQLQIVETVSNPDRFKYGRFGESVLLTDLDLNPGEELIVGAPGGSGSGFPGYVLIYSPNGVGGSFGTPIAVQAPAPHHVPNNLFGTSIAVGDVDGDAHSDLVVGAPGDFPGELSLSGLTFVFFGPNLTSSLVLRYYQGGGTAQSAWFGWRVDVGEIDSHLPVGGDPAPEIVVSAQRYDSAPQVGRCLERLTK